MIGVLDGARQTEEMLLFIIYMLPWVFAERHGARQPRKALLQQKSNSEPLMCWRGILSCLKPCETVQMIFMLE